MNVPGRPVHTWTRGVRGRTMSASATRAVARRCAAAAASAPLASGSHLRSRHRHLVPTIVASSADRSVASCTPSTAPWTASAGAWRGWSATPYTLDDDDPVLSSPRTPAPPLGPPRLRSAATCDGTRSYHSSARTRADAGAGADPSSPAIPRPPGEVYHAHLAETVRNVKLLSLASLAATVCGTPLLLELASPNMLPEAKLTVSLVVDGFGAFTTGLLQWFVAPYVLRMRMVDEHTVAVDKLTLFARTFEERFPAGAMVEAETARPLVTWEAEGKLHYVEMANVPEYLYDRLELERFDAQAQAEKHAMEARARGDEDDEDD